MYIYSYTNEDIEINANLAKEALLYQLEADGLIKDAGKICGNYIIVVHKKGRFGQAWDKIRGLTDKDALKFVVAKTQIGKD